MKNNFEQNQLCFVRSLRAEPSIWFFNHKQKTNKQGQHHLILFRSCKAYHNKHFPINQDGIHWLTFRHAVRVTSGVGSEILPQVIKTSSQYWFFFLRMNAHKVYKSVMGRRTTESWGRVYRELELERRGFKWWFEICSDGQSLLFPDDRLERSLPV